MELAPYLCYQLDFLLDFFTEDKSYQYLQDATSISFLSDKSAEILGSKYLIIWNLSYTGRLVDMELRVHMQMRQK